MKSKEWHEVKVKDTAWKSRWRLEPVFVKPQ
jgi:hypothetical protein